jgi:predicted Zn-dependent protease
VTGKPRSFAVRRAVWIALAAGVGLVGAVLFIRRPPAPALPRVSAPEADEESRLRGQIRDSPRDEWPRLALVSLLLNRGRNYDALDVALQARATFPNSAEVARQLAEAQFRTARQPEAVNTLRPLARGALLDRLQLAGYMVRMGQRERGVTLLKQGEPILSAAEAIQAGKLCMEAMEVESAVSLLRPAVRQNPGQMELQSLYGLALILSGRYREAARVLEVPLRVAPLPTLQFYAGSAIRLSGDRKRLREAESYLRSAAEREPRNGLFLYELGVCRMALQDWSGAQGPLELAASLLPDTPEIHRDLASVYVKLGLMRPAAIVRAHYLRNVNDPAAAVRVLQPLWAKNRSDVETGILLASAQYAARTGPDAAALLKSLRDREPGRLEILRAQLSMLRATRRWKEARNVIGELERHAPDNPEALGDRAVVEHALGEFGEEEKARRRLCELEPDDPEHHYELGQFLMLSSPRADRLTAAEASFHQALALRPDYPEVHLALGTLLDKTGRPGEAVPELRATLDAAPENRDAVRALGRAYLKLGDKARSDDMFRILRRLQARADEQTRLETQLDEVAGRDSTPAYREYLRQRRKALVRFLLRAGSLRVAVMELELLEHGYPDDPEVHRLLEPLYGHGRRFQRQFEQRRLLKGGSLTGSGA